MSRVNPLLLAAPTFCAPDSAHKARASCARPVPALARRRPGAAEAAVDVDGLWGGLGRFLLTPVLEKHGLYERALEPRVLYPIEPDQFRKPFLPEWRDLVAKAVEGATFLHLWSEAIRWAGYAFDLRPPEGSHLWERFRKVGALGRFRRAAGADEIRRLMDKAMAANENGA